MKTNLQDEVGRTQVGPGRLPGLFDGVVQTEVRWGAWTFCNPIFYYDTMQIQAQFLAPLGAVTALLPSRRLHPLRATPWHAPVVIAAWQHRTTDIGPYNELAIGVPVSLSGPVRPFTGLLWSLPAEQDFYLIHLPVTTDIACELGIDLGAYPKFIANIDFTEDREWMTCRLSEGDQYILTFGVRKRSLKHVPRSHMHPTNVRDGRLLRSAFILDEHEESTSGSRADVRLELGTHPVADHLKQLQLGKLASCTYTPALRAILTQVQETYAA